MVNFSVLRSVSNFYSKEDFLNSQRLTQQNWKTKKVIFYSLKIVQWIILMAVYWIPASMNFKSKIRTLLLHSVKCVVCKMRKCRNVISFFWCKIDTYITSKCDNSKINSTHWICSSVEKVCFYHIDFELSNIHQETCFRIWRIWLQRHVFFSSLFL